MTWGMAEAGNRASKTGHYLQWLDTEAGCDASIPGEWKVHNKILFNDKLGPATSPSASLPPPPFPRTPSTALPFHPSHPPHPSVRPFTSSLERCACKTIDSCVFISIEARLAQSVERKALNLVVVGSSPTVGDSCYRVCSLRPRRSRRRAPFAASLVSAVCDGPLRRVSAGTLPLN